MTLLMSYDVLNQTLQLILTVKIIVIKLMKKNELLSSNNISSKLINEQHFFFEQTIPLSLIYIF